MRLFKGAFALLLALDMLIILLAIYFVKPMWILLGIVGCSLLKGLHNHLRVRSKMGQYYKQKNRLRMKLGLPGRSR